MFAIEMSSSESSDSGSFTGSDQSTLAIAEQDDPEFASTLDRIYQACAEPENWGTAENRIADTAVQGNVQLLRRVESLCRSRLKGILGTGGTLGPIPADNNEPREIEKTVYADLLPPTSTLPQLFALYCALKPRTPPYDDTSPWSVARLIKSITSSATSPQYIFFVRETPGALYLSRVEETAALPDQVSSSIRTHVILRLDMGPHSMSDVLRSRKCDWSDASPSPQSIVAQYYSAATPSTDDSASLSTIVPDADGTSLPDDNSTKTDNAGLDYSKRFLYVCVEHQPDRYKTKTIYNIVSELDSGPSSTSEPDTISEIAKMLHKEASCRWIRWDHNTFSHLEPGNSTVTTISDVFRHQNARLDIEYASYCDQNADPVWVDDTMFMRNMQAQERLIALAGLMARRFFNGVRHFANNMRATAKANVVPMTVDETIRTLNQLDLRRGPGSFARLLRVPQRTEMPKYALSRLPAMFSTWTQFCDKQKLLEGTLEPHMQ